MQIEGNTIFITGGSSGIGAGLAVAFRRRGNQVIVSGRRADRLRQVCGNSGMAYVVLDVTDAKAIREVAGQVIGKFPALNCVFNNAGVQMRGGISADGSLDEQALETEVGTNLLGPIRVAAAFLPHLAKQKKRNSGERIVGTGVRADGTVSCLQCDEGGDSFMDADAPTRVAEEGSQGNRIGSSVRHDGTGRTRESEFRGWPGGHAARSVRCRDHEGAGIGCR